MQARGSSLPVSQHLRELQLHKSYSNKSNRAGNRLEQLTMIPLKPTVEAPKDREGELLLSRFWEMHFVSKACMDLGSEFHGT